MATAFNRLTARGVGVVPATMEGYVVAANVQVITTVLRVTNITAGPIVIGANLSDGTNETALLRNHELAANQSETIELKTNMKVGDRVRLVSDTAASLDAVLSLVERS